VLESQGEIAPRVCVRARAGLRIACVRGAAARRARVLAARQLGHGHPTHVHASRVRIAFPGGLLVNGATARPANTHAARGPALPPPSS